MEQLIRQIDAFMDRHQMEPSRFGLIAANDSHLYFHILDGKRKLRKRTLARVLAKMAEFDLMAVPKPRKNGRKK